MNLGCPRCDGRYLVGLLTAMGTVGVHCLSYSDEKTRVLRRLPRKDQVALITGASARVTAPAVKLGAPVSSRRGKGVSAWLTSSPSPLD